MTYDDDDDNDDGTVLLEHANDSILPKLETIYVHNNDDLIIENNDNWEYDNENGIVFRL